MTDLIQTTDLTKSFGEVTAVDGLSISIPPGEIFGLLGPNGAGKTTTLRMLTALIAPTGGEARVAGHTIGADDYHVRKNVGILTESPGLYDRLSAERNLDFFARLYEVEDIPGQVERYLRMLGLWDRRGDEVGKFSKGMRQKIAIARALLHEPVVLLLDEPTSGLDPEAARTVRHFIGELRAGGRAILICTHNLDEADRLCDRIAIFKSRLLALDTPTELRLGLFGRSSIFHLAKAEERFANALAEKDFVQSAQVVDNKIVVTLDDLETHNPALVRILVDQGAEVQFVGEMRRSLEDVYLHYIQNDADLEVD
ncbi:MAG: ABC transporter ATP-binding protein [Anaerolineae bacterium]|nr:ABC transporter ATP-binding protein [Anaerolineae bacterium]